MKMEERPKGKRQNRGESGQAIVLLALIMVGLLGFAGLALDGGNLYTEQRRAQAAADNAVMAAAYSMMKNTTSFDALRGVALGAAAVNRYNNDRTANWVEFHRPPVQGPYTGNNDYLEVVITQTVPTALVHLVFGQNPVPLTVYSVAQGKPTGPLMAGYAIVSFREGCDGNEFTPRGGVGAIIKDGGVFVNSLEDCSQAINTSGSNARLATTTSSACPDDSIPPDQPGGCHITGDYPIDIGGGQTGTNSEVCADPPPAIDWWTSPGTDCNFYPAPNDYSPRYASYPIPATTSDFTCGPNKDHLLSGGGSAATLEPGSYTHMNAHKDLTLQPGIYCITGTGSANKVMDARSLRGHGVFIYIAQETAEFKYSGGVLSLSAPFHGENGLDCTVTPEADLCRIAGIVIFKPEGRNTCSNSNIEIGFTGNSDMVVRGLIWAPRSYLVYAGNGDLYMHGQALVGCVKYAGNGELDITYSPDDTYTPPPYVRLVQ
jgi:hypothetical protein